MPRSRRALVHGSSQLQLATLKNKDCKSAIEEMSHCLTESFHKVEALTEENRLLGRALSEYFEVPGTAELLREVAALEARACFLMENLEHSVERLGEPRLLPSQPEQEE
eukprot:CAMPEP_0171108622 /NCGR_PEP_ID=MMETSP0766_2-20121228/69281_1 /TAXON_ID=439317 /ORGANISM="Gambierdiscus australes, Strain CAWD 149" /LENGTH=108 /DNA_ID=CAMNT_0011570195 /DNA_START=71 /DNA_END=397 /DNA_ORIENTATION=+